jgi:isocitrate dehydrogenase kinase/phosphatase
MHSGAWYYVDPRERCLSRSSSRSFLGLDAGLRQALMDAHGDIFDVQWWLDLQQGLNAGRFADVPPYPQRMRLQPGS